MKPMASEQAWNRNRAGRGRGDTLARVCPGAVRVGAWSPVPWL